MNIRLLNRIFPLIAVVSGTSFILVTSSWAQSNADAPQLLAEYESFPCSEFRYLTDQMMVAISNSPGSNGYIVNSGPKEKLAQLVWREELVKEQIAVRRFDRSRIGFAIAESDGPLRTEYWKVSSPDHLPKIGNIVDSLVLTKVEKPFLLIEDNFYNDSECPDANYARILARFLSANRGARGNLVFYGRNSREIRSRENKVIRALTETHNIDRNRLRIFHRIAIYDPEHPKGIEYWYLP